jgi:hypothetical protein
MGFGVMKLTKQIFCVHLKCDYQCSLLTEYFSFRGFYNKELHDLYSSPSIIRITKSRRMRWAGHVARMERRGMLIDFWWESQRERDTRKTKT